MKAGWWWSIRNKLRSCIVCKAMYWQNSVLWFLRKASERYIRGSTETISFQLGLSSIMFSVKSLLGMNRGIVGASDLLDSSFKVFGLGRVAGCVCCSLRLM